MYNVGTPSDTHSVEEGKPDHSLEDIKQQLVFGLTHYLFRELEDSVRPHKFFHYLMQYAEYAELKSKVRVQYSDDIFKMYHDTIWNCQSYSEVKKFCNLFLKGIGYAYMEHHRPGMLRYVVYQLKEEWEEVLGGEPLIDI